MEERGGKTIICSVFFLDIVEYSKKSVSGQISLKERFNAFLSTAIRDVPINDRIILDTGDGAAVSFLGDVEDALRAALSMRSSLLSEEGLMDPPLLVRMGVNLGPVRLVRDINGQPNIVGDGINVAQRVMGFADPGQILVSRSYYDAASRLSQEYAGMFHYSGSRTDKHVREHEVYAIGYPGDFSATQSHLRLKSETKFSAKFQTKAKEYLNILSARYEEFHVYVLEKFKQASTAQKALYVVLAVAPFLLLLLLLIKLAHKPVVPIKALPKAAAVSSPAVNGAASGVPPAPIAPAATSNSTKPAPQEHGSKPAAHKKTEKKQDKKQESLEKKTQEKTKDASAESAKAGGQCLISLVVKPWGEIYLDGKMVGVSPPLTKLQVSPGSHLIELKNANFPVYQQTIKAKVGEKLNISHKFAN